MKKQSQYRPIALGTGAAAGGGSRIKALAESLKAQLAQFMGQHGAAAAGGAGVGAAAGGAAGYALGKDAEAYAQGFIDKCAEVGIDAVELAQQAPVLLGLTPAQRNYMGAQFRRAVAAGRVTRVASGGQNVPIKQAMLPLLAPVVAGLGVGGTALTAGTLGLGAIGVGSALRTGVKNRTGIFAPNSLARYVPGLNAIRAVAGVNQ